MTALPPRPGSGRRLWSLAAALLASAFLGGPAQAGQDAGKAAADFTLLDGAGQKLQLSSLRGKVVVLDFWASWCEPCKKELPELARIQRELGDKVVILALNIDRERATGQEAARRLGPGLKVLFDPEGKVAERYDPPKMPTSYVIDRQGVVRFIHEGYDGAADAARLRRELAGLTK